MPVIHLLLIFVFLLTLKTGFSAEISVETGTSVKLDIQTQQLSEINVLMWGNDKSTIITWITSIKQVLYGNSYEQRVEFNDETLSMTLKNMTKTDSGVYRARSNNELLAEYTVSVIDAVEAPVLTVNSNQSSSNSCTVNFTCRAHELTLNSTYNSGRCSQKVPSEGIYPLVLNCSEKSIICNHSNPVSWKEDRINITQLCVKIEKTPRKDESSPLSLPTVVYVLVMLTILAVFFVIVYRKCKKGAQGEVVEGNTVYAQVEAQEIQKLNSDCHTYDIPDKVQAQTQEETEDKRPNTTYCTVGQYNKTTSPPETDHTIYAAVCKQSNKKIPPDDT